MKELSRRTKNVVRPLHRAIRDYALQRGYKDLVYLNVGEPDFNTPKHIIDAAKLAMDSGLTHYTEDKGLLELREVISDELKVAKGADIGPQSIVVTNGAFEAILAVLMTLVNQGEEVILPDPGWPTYVSAVRLAGGRPTFVPINMKTQEWDIEVIKKSVNNRTKAIIVNSPNNPTGAVYNKELLRLISELAKERDLYVISDEVYDAFVYEEEPYHTMVEFPDTMERTIIVNSFSKTFAMTGWRIGYVAASPMLASEILKIKGTINVCASSISQYAALAALRGSRDCVKNMLKEYRVRRQILLDGLEIPGITCPRPKGAFYAFPDISSFGKDSVDFTRYLIDKAHVVVSPGIAFGPKGEGHIRISYACSRQDLALALERMKEVLLENH